MSDALFVFLTFISKNLGFQEIKKLEFTFLQDIFFSLHIPYQKHHFIIIYLTYHSLISLMGEDQNKIQQYWNEGKKYLKCIK